MIPPEYTLSSSGESLMLWDSGYSTQTRRSFLWGTSTNAMEDAAHCRVIDGTFKSAPHLFTQLFTVHGLFPVGWYLPLFYGLLPRKTLTLYRNLLQEIDSYGDYQPQFILPVDAYDEYSDKTNYLKAIVNRTMV